MEKGPKIGPNSCQTRVGGAGSNGMFKDDSVGSVPRALSKGHPVKLLARTAGSATPLFPANRAFL